MKEKIYYYDRNGVLKLTLNEYPYYTEWADLRDWQWGYNEQFGRYTSFRRDKHERELVIAIAGDYLKAHDDLCDIFAADVIAGQAGQLRANDWTLNCYITEAEYEYGYALSRKAVFKVMSEDPSWIRKNTRVLSGETEGETDEDYGRDYTIGFKQYGSNTDPYLFRQSPQFSEEYNRETDLLVGGSVAWNQLVEPSSTTTTNNGVTFTGDGNGGYTLTNTATGTAYRNLSINIISGHKYYLCGGISASIYTILTPQASWSGTRTEYGTGVIASCVASSAGSLSLQVVNGTATGGAKVYPQLFDLTQMFGSTIADAIYAMEQSTSGSGVAFFKKLFPNSYYPYNSGELMSVSGVSSHDMTGFNQWDEEWEVGSINGTTGQPLVSSTTIRSKNYCKCVPSTLYHVYCGSANSQWWVRVFFYDADFNFIDSNWYSNLNVATPSNACYFKILTNGDTSYGATYKNDICINLSSSRNGEYEPYVKHSYPLDSSLTLRGIPKLSNGKLYYDGDTYASDGTVTRKYGAVDLGTLSWDRASNAGIYRFQSSGFSGGKGYANNVVANIITARYKADTWNNTTGTADDKSIALLSTGNIIAIQDDAYTDKAAFKTAMSGVYLVYELATPTTETAEPYTDPQVVDESGTEEYVSTSIVPVGHQTGYGIVAPLRGYNYGYSLTDVHTIEITLPSSQNGYEVLFYGPIADPAIYLNGHPVQVNVTLTAGQRLRVVSNGSEKTIKILSSTGVETDAFIYRSKEYSPFIDIGQHTEVSFGDFRFEFTTIERRSEPTWT